jgi:hypothetical protein
VRFVKKYSSDYGRKIVTTLSTQLVKKCGQAFDIHNIRRIVRFAEKFIKLRIVTPVATQFSWTGHLSSYSFGNGLFYNATWRDCHGTKTASLLLGVSMIQLFLYGYCGQGRWRHLNNHGMGAISKEQEVYYDHYRKSTNSGRN